LFGKKKEIKPHNPIKYEGKHILILANFSEPSANYQMIDNLVGKGYKVIGVAGMDGYLTYLQKPTNGSEE
jgi:hypothetical protein